MYKRQLLYHIVHEFPSDEGSSSEAHPSIKKGYHGWGDYTEYTEYIANVRGWQLRKLFRTSIEESFFKNPFISTYRSVYKRSDGPIQLHPDNKRFRFRNVVQEGKWKQKPHRQPWVVEFPMVQTYTDGDSYYVHVPSGAVVWGQWEINAKASSIKSGPDDMPWTMCCALLR